MTPDDPGWTVVAHLLRPQGRRGEVLAHLLTDFPDRFREGSTVFAVAENKQPVEGEMLRLVILTSWMPQGRNAGRIVLGFEGVTSIDEAERLGGLDLVVPRSDRVALTDGSVYQSDLVGCALHDKDVFVGYVREVLFATTPDGKRRLEEAAPLLAVDLATGEALIPFVASFVLALDLAGKRIVMDLPEGLVEVNQTRTDPEPG